MRTHAGNSANPAKATKDGWRVDSTPDQDAEKDLRAAIVAADKPLNDWLRDMAASDKDMPRWLEEHIEFSHAGRTPSTFQQAAYDAKKVLRGQKP